MSALLLPALSLTLTTMTLGLVAITRRGAFWDDLQHVKRSSRAIDALASEMTGGRHVG